MYVGVGLSAQQPARSARVVPLRFQLGAPYDAFVSGNRCGATWIVALGGFILGCKERAPGAPIPCEGAARVAGVASEVCVPGGDFQMGHAAMRFVGMYPPPSGLENPWAPQHTVYLDPFFIDKYEVTIARYMECVRGGACGPLEPYQYDDPSSDSALQDHPAIATTPSAATQFCQWDEGRRLPTEAEWEKAARGTDGRDFPWGNDLADCTGIPSHQTCTGSYGPPPKVGSDPKDVSPYGSVGMAAGVSEFTFDWYDALYYAVSPRLNPTGPTGPSENCDTQEGTTRRCEERVARGGTSGGLSGPTDFDRWKGGTIGSPTWGRSHAGCCQGFRCARPASAAGRIGAPRVRGAAR